MKIISLHKRFIFKVGIGILCFIVALGVTIVIRDSLAVKHPEHAIPELRVTHYSEYLPVEYYEVGAYSWRFLFNAIDYEMPYEQWAYKMKYGPIAPNAPMQLEFSYPCKNFKMSVSKNGGEFKELETVRYDSDVINEMQISKNGYFLSFPGPGEYIYRIQGSWGVRGSAMYYLKLITS